MKRSSGVGVGVALGLGALVYLLIKNKASAANAPAGSSPPPVTLPTVTITPSNPFAQYTGSAAAGLAAPAAPSWATLPGSSAPTASQNSVAAAYWATLIPTNALPSGWINFPSGAQAPAADFTSGLTATDGVGTYFVYDGTDVYSLGPMDSSGNYPATLVAGG